MWIMRFLISVTATYAILLTSLNIATFRITGVNMKVLQLDNITKSFEGLRVLKGLDLEIELGSIYGFIGRNGSGKTTTMKMIVGLLKPDSGHIFINGAKVHFGQTPTNRMIGYLPDVPQFYGFLTHTST
jgi:ABC-2 type transport system ATP-binding protein